VPTGLKFISEGRFQMMKPAFLHAQSELHVTGPRFSGIIITARSQKMRTYRKNMFHQKTMMQCHRIYYFRGIKMVKSAKALHK